MQVVDWEDGGRTSAEHCKRIYEKEQEQGPQRVLPVVHRCVWQKLKANCLLVCLMAERARTVLAVCESTEVPWTLNFSAILQAQWLPCRGINGVSFSDGLDKRATFPQRPAYGSPDIETSPYAEVHCSIHRLLAGVKAAEVDPETA